jgi:hypothetical protein
MVRCINLMNRVRKLQLLASTLFAYYGSLDKIVSLIIARYGSTSQKVFRSRAVASSVLARVSVGFCRGNPFLYDP